MEVLLCWQLTIQNKASLNWSVRIGYLAAELPRACGIYRKASTVIGMCAEVTYFAILTLYTDLALYLNLIFCNGTALF